eukprot:5009752-Amphidinium_carterae.1
MTPSSPCSCFSCLSLSPRAATQTRHQDLKGSCSTLCLSTSAAVGSSGRLRTLTLTPPPVRLKYRQHRGARHSLCSRLRSLCSRLARPLGDKVRDP